MKRDEQIKFMQEHAERMKQLDERFKANEQCVQALQKFDYLLDDEPKKAAFG